MYDYHHRHAVSMDHVDLNYIGWSIPPIEEFAAILSVFLKRIAAEPMFSATELCTTSAAISCTRHILGVTGCIENGPDMVEALGDYMRPAEMFEPQYWISTPPERHVLRTLADAMMKLPNTFDGDAAFERASILAASRSIRGMSGDLLED